MGLKSLVKEMEKVQKESVEKAVAEAKETWKEYGIKDDVRNELMVDHFIQIICELYDVIDGYTNDLEINDLGIDVLDLFDCFVAEFIAYAAKNNTPQKFVAQFFDRLTSLFGDDEDEEDEDEYEDDEDDDVGIEIHCVKLDKDKMPDEIKKIIDEVLEELKKK